MNSLIKEKVSLRDYNTAKISAVTKYFAEVQNSDEIARALDFADEKKCSVLFLGKGSNIVFKSDYRGLIIKVADNNIFSEIKEEQHFLTLGAGVFLPEIAKKSAQQSWSGLEWAGGVPGSIGGAVRGNAGAFKENTADCVTKVFVFDKEKRENVVFNNQQCLFDYRESIFKKSGNYIILKAEFLLKKDLSAQNKYKKYFQYRLDNHPQEPSFGSTFKNPPLEKEALERNTDLEQFRQLGFIPVRYLIEQCGLRGYRSGGAQISEKHPNFIINKGGAKGGDFVTLITVVKDRVKDHFGISLEEEVEIV